ncbi:MAG: terminase [Dissulfurispiraceae bacterium]
MSKPVSKKNEVEAELHSVMASFSKDPYSWVLFSFPWGEGDLAGETGPDEWQTELLCLIRDGLMTPDEAVMAVLQMAVSSGHDVGKTCFLCWILLWGLSTFADTRVIVTANTETQLKTKTWPELKKWHRLCICSHWFQYNATSIHSVDPAHKETWRADMIPWSENNTEAFAGLHNKKKRIILIFDEASAIFDKIWEVSEGALLDSDTEILWLAFGNPTRNTGRFKDCFDRFKHRWVTRQIDSRTSKISNKAKIREWIDDYGIDSDFVKVRVRGMFPSMSAKQFFSVEDCDAALRRELRKEQFEFAPVVLTLDNAWEGDDMLEIGKRQGLAFKILRTIPKNDNDIQIANILSQMADDEKADAVFIDAAFGTGIVSAGRTWGKDWQLVWSAGKPSRPGFANKRAELADEVKTWLKSGGSIYGQRELYDDLLAPETVPRSDGKVQLEDKKLIKKRLGRSPGKFDALAISFAYPVSKKYAGGSLGKPRAVSSDYNPYDEEHY